MVPAVAAVLPSLSAAQFLRSILLGPLSAAEEQGQAGCDLGTGISLRQFSRLWSGELPGGLPVEMEHPHFHMTVVWVLQIPGTSPLTQRPGWKGPLEAGPEHVPAWAPGWPCSGGH